MMNSDISNAVSVVAFFAVGFGLLRVINRFEPQWVSKDGLRFTAKISLDSAATDKWTEVRVLVDGNAIVISGRGRKARAIKGRWAVSYSADAQDVRRRHFVIARSGEINSSALLSVPATSRCVAVLDALTKA
ncbi:MAG: hypothetical protein EBT42_04520 [Actinobacteria bacterium]|nr:hypothetical protein [Actinomycetota bacterium]